MTFASRTLVVTLLLLLANTAFGAQLRTDVATRRVGVGQAFEVKISATHKDGEPAPRNPQLNVQGKARVSRPSVGTRRSVTMRNLSFDSETSTVATWVVTPEATGKLVIGPGSFTVAGKKIRGETIVVEVVKEAQQTRRRSPLGGGSIFGPDPSDIFGDDPFDRMRRGFPSPSIPDAPREYQVDRAPDPTSFLRIILDKERAVLGEPVRLTVLAYGSRGNFREVSPNEPSFPDFLSYSVIETSHDEPPYRTLVDDQEFLVRKLREYILIPLTSGTLEIGGMTAVLQGNRNAYPIQGSPLGMKVVSPDVQLEVTPAPQKNRPDGYFPGDVGDYRLEATVHPRTVSEGEYAEVILEIKGSGQIPSKVLLPESPSLVWEPPTLSGGPEVRDGKLQGTRVLKYALQLKESGELDLGEVTLPFYDHRKRTYKIARAELGTITVDANANAQLRTADPDGGQDALHQDDSRDTALDQGLPLAPRNQAGPFTGRRKWRTPPWLWWVLLGLPAVVGLSLTAGRWLGARLRGREGSRKSDAQRHLRAAKAELPNDPNAGYRLLERGIYDSLDRATGQKTRGHLREHLARELIKSGMDEALAREVQAFLIQLEELRYDMSAREGAQPLSEASTLVARITRAERQLSKQRASQGGAP